MALAYIDIFDRDWRLRVGRIAFGSHAKLAVGVDVASGANGALTKLHIVFRQRSCRKYDTAYTRTRTGLSCHVMSLITIN